jgi:nucleoside recognition membrane protein YjiH
VGIVLTIKQYEDGRYSGREAVSVATNFPIVLLPFCPEIAETAGLGHIFFTWYLTVVVVCLVCAAIMVWLPPLVTITEDYYGPTGKCVYEEKLPGVSSLRWGCDQALVHPR